MPSREVGEPGRVAPINSFLDRGTSDLAAQPELGVLPEWRSGLDCDDPDCLAFAGQTLNRRMKGGLFCPRLAFSIQRLPAPHLI
jgi:hypothetical protein